MKLGTTRKGVVLLTGHVLRFQLLSYFAVVSIISSLFSYLAEFSSTQPARSQFWVLEISPVAGFGQF